MSFSSHFIANTPPPWASKKGPYDALLHSTTSQPEFESELASQFVRFTPLSFWFNSSDRTGCSIVERHTGIVPVNVEFGSNKQPTYNSWVRNQATKLKDVTWFGMPCNLVVFIIMHSFENVDFSILVSPCQESRKPRRNLTYCWPVTSDRPESRPDRLV